MKFSGAGLGENLNGAEANPFKLSRKGILIDNDFANGLFVRQTVAGRKPVDENLGAVRARGWPSERIQLCREFVGIVSQRIQFLAADYPGRLIAVRIRADAAQIIDPGSTT